MKSGWEYALRLFVFTLFLIVGGCAEERPVKDVIANNKRIAKSVLGGTYHYLRTIQTVQFAPAPLNLGSLLAPGIYVDSDKLVQFRISETTLDVVSIDPLYHSDRPARVNSTLLSFPIRHVDVLPKQNFDGKDTHEREETENRRVWQEREFVVVDLTKNLVDASLAPLSTSAGTITVDPSAGAINFSTTKQESSGAVLAESYSFLKLEEGARSYIQRPYLRSVQEQFGFFKTTTYAFDSYGRMTEATKREYMNRWNSDRNITYYFSPGFPERLKPMVRKVFAHWNETFLVALGRPLLTIKENSGETPGDLRYNLIVYDDTEMEHGLMGYGPHVTNPRTGEIIKADVFIYGGALRRAIYNERKWAKLTNLNPKKEFTPNPVPVVSLQKTSEWVSHLKQVGVLQPATIARAEKLFVSPDSTLSEWRKELSSSQRQCATELDADAMEGIARAIAENEVTDDELEEQIFFSLLTHELGHNLGLRHNFMGSADEAHYHPTGKSSTAMDYGFLSALEPAAPGPYDAAAIAVLYGNDEPRSVLDVRPFLFCSDEQLFDSRFGLCHQYDSGSNLVQIAQHLMKRYVGSYQFNNVKGDRAHFGYDEDEYARKVLRYLVELRLLFDHANAIVESAKKDPLTEADLKHLWLLLRAQIEATTASEDVATFELLPDTRVSVDRDKIAIAKQDAEKARQNIFSYLKLIITEDKRPEYDETDPVFRDFQTRGVLTDKLLALLVTAFRSTNPLGGGNGVSLFDSLHQEMAALYSSLISNTETQGNPFNQEVSTGLHLYNPNLRSLATSVLFNLAESQALESGEFKELLRIERIVSSDDHVRKNLSTLHQEYRNILFELEATTDETRQQELQQKLFAKKDEMAGLNFSAMSVRDGLELKSVRRLDAFRIPTATGLLLGENLSLMEDRLWVANQMLASTEIRIRNCDEGPEKIALLGKKRSLEEMQLHLNRYIDTEKSLVERIYRRYSAL